MLLSADVVELCWHVLPGAAAVVAPVTTAAAAGVLALFADINRLTAVGRVWVGAALLLLLLLLLLA